MQKTIIPLDHELLKKWAHVHHAVHEQIEDLRRESKKMVDESWDLLRESLKELGLLPEGYNPYFWSMQYCEAENHVHVERIDESNIVGSFVGKVPDHIIELMLDFERKEPGTIDKVMKDTVRFDDL